MIGRFEVWLDDVALSSISGDAYVRDVKYSAPTMQDTTHGYGSNNGALVVRRYVGNITVTVNVEIHVYNTVERQRVCEALAVWASRGGTLKTSDKPDKQIDVICQTFPSITSALSWTDALPITFVSYAFPYWEDDVPTLLSLSGTSDSGTMFGVGYADRPFVSADVEVKSGTLTSLSLTVGNTNITLSNISVLLGGVVRIGYDKRHLMVIDADGVSLYSKRTPTSNDDLRLEVGVDNEVSVDADASVEVTFVTRGLYW